MLVDISKGPEPTRLISDKPYFMIRRSWHSEMFLQNNQPIGYMYLLEPLDEAPVAAIATGPIALVDNSPCYCTVEVGYGDYKNSFNLTVRDPRDPPTQDDGSDEELLGWTPWGTLDSFTTKMMSVVPHRHRERGELGLDGGADAWGIDGNWNASKAPYFDRAPRPRLVGSELSSTPSTGRTNQGA